MSGYDVFLSSDGPDRARAGRLVQLLTSGGLRVFLDEPAVPSRAAEAALGASKTLLAYYSAGYPGRWAHQLRLTAAFLAGQREGDPVSRLIVVNPEPTTGHLYPAELADAKVVLAPPNRAREAVTDFVAAVRARAEAVPGTFGPIRMPARPPWWAEGPPDAAPFIGRYREQWTLHTRLHECRPEPAVVALTGRPGSGRSSLAAAYAWQFGPAYPGGVFWTGLAGATAADGLARYADEVRRVARRLRLDGDVERAGLRDLTAAVADRIVVGGQPALWIVDDVPPDLAPEAAAELLVPAAPVLRTVLIGRRDAHPTLSRAVIAVDRLDLDDARRMLREYGDPQPGPAEAEAFDALALRLDGHAFTLRLTGQHVRRRPDLLPYAGYLPVEPTTVDTATELLREVIGELGLTERVILQLATVCGRAPVPEPLIARVVAAVRPRDPDPGEALIRLRDRLLATRTGDRWQFHPIVVDAARRHLTPILAGPDLARLAADRLLRLVRTADPATLADLMPHAAALNRNACPDAAVGEPLRRLLWAYHHQRGDARAAARHADELVGQRPPDVADRLLAAQTHAAAGDHEATIRHALEVHRLAPVDDATRRTADRLLAGALDASGRLAEADRYWDRLAAADPDPDGRATLDYVRSRRRRGDLRTALAVCVPLVDALTARGDGEAGDHLQAARIELAHLLASTGAAGAAQRAADAVLRHYHDRGRTGHAEAEASLAQAWLILHPLHPGVEPGEDRAAARTLDDVRLRLRERYGPFDPRTLAADVEYGDALLCVGQPARAEAHLAATLDRLHRRFGPGRPHPFTLRTVLLLGRSYAHQGDAVRARERHEEAYRALCAELGPRHPETLVAQYGLGVALVRTGQRRRGARLLRGVRRLAPSTVGRRSDLYRHSVVAGASAALPAWLWRLADRLTRAAPPSLAD